MRSPLRRLLFCTIVALAAVIAPSVGHDGRLGLALPALAAYNTCTGVHQSHWDGEADFPTSTGDYMWGASAWINTRAANFCVSPPSAAPDNSMMTWSMVASPNGNYAQSGYGTFDTDPSNIHYFVENTGADCPGQGGIPWCRRYFGTVQPGHNDQYYEDYDSTYHRIDEWIDSYLVQYTDYDPTDSSQTNGNWWSGPWKGEFYGETHDAGDGVAGSSGYKASFTSLGYAPNQTPEPQVPQYNYITGSTQITGSQTETYYCYEYNGTADFNIWEGTPSC